MSIVITQPATLPSSPSLLRLPKGCFGLLLSALLTPLSLVILGYHPYAEDGGLYLAGVKYLLNPSLFPHFRAFVTAPLTYSVFAPGVAFLIRHSGLSFGRVVFALFVLCLFATIFAAWQIAQVCFSGILEQVGATFLVALWLNLPVAGTSLMLIDPYLTARSFSTPLVLLALAAALRAVAVRRSPTRGGGYNALVWAAMWIALAALFHPLMAGYGAGLILAALWMESRRPQSTLLKAASLIAAALACAAALQAISAIPSAAVARVSLTRSYWFLARWEWFEVLGLLAPLLILFIFLKSNRFGDYNAFARVMIVGGVAAIAISLCFARPGLLSFSVSHLQPLRVFQSIYFALFLGLGACLARFVLHDVWWRWGVAGVLLAAPVMIPAWLVFPYSAHIEWPRSASVTPNKWVAAFLWIKDSTPSNALFALDANYISNPKEEAQSFRPIAERSSLPDFSKDGGESSVNPSLSNDWVRGVDAQTNLSSESDQARDRALRGLGVTWMVLESQAATAALCPYDNGTVKVCQFGTALSGTPSSSK